MKDVDWIDRKMYCMLAINTPKQKKEEAIKIVDPVSADNLVI